MSILHSIVHESYGFFYTIGRGVVFVCILAGIGALFEKLPDWAQSIGVVLVKVFFIFLMIAANIGLPLGAALLWLSKGDRGSAVFCLVFAAIPSVVTFFLVKNAIDNRRASRVKP